MADPVIIVDYDPAWPARFAAEAEALLRSLGGAHGLEHIGSTAVPGLAAKPVIDILLAVDDAALLETTGEEQAVPGEGKPITPAGEPAHVALVQAIASCDFTYRGVNGLPGRLYFFRHGSASAHVHVAQRDSWFVHDQLLFSDWLRAHPDDAARYEALKRGLAGRFRDDRVAYTNAKSDFIRDVLLRAGGVGPWLGET
ncbi:MAG: GrpB family protein [Planctomycetes bacterium]|nr:GrpB family protein [Planctomycetota bacterium]MCB9936300.1 GrpB family protein [Planctomycetota bacterium]